MEESIKESGNMENSTGRENFLILKLKFGKKEFGVMDVEFNGTILQLLKIKVFKQFIYRFFKIFFCLF